MTNFRTLVAAAVTAGSLALSLHLLQARAQDDTLPPPAKGAAKAATKAPAQPAAKGAPAGGDTTSSGSGAASDAHALDVKILQIQARLAEIDWQKAVDSNKQVPGTFTAEEVQRRLETYKVAKQRADQVAAGAGKQMSEALRVALANSKLYDDNYRKALAANKNDPTAVPALEVERLKVLTDLGRLMVAREKSSGSGQAVAGNMTAGMEDLREEVSDLRRRVEMLEETAK